MGNQRLFVLRGAVGCAAGGGITWGGREGREGGGSRLFADTLSDSVGAELERPASVRRVLLLAQAARLPRSPREGALLVVGAVRVRDAGHEGGNTRRGEIVGILKPPDVLKHLLHAALGCAVGFVRGGSKLGKWHRRAGVVAGSARDGAQGQTNHPPDHCGVDGRIGAAYAPKMSWRQGEPTCKIWGQPKLPPTTDGGPCPAAGRCPGSLAAARTARPPPGPRVSLWEPRIFHPGLRCL